MNDRSRSLREHFSLRDDVVFLNHGSFGACPAPVFAVYQRWQRELEAEPVEFLARRFPNLMAQARAALGEYVTANPDEIVFVPNATTALNIVARALPLQPGDEVLGTNHEYGAIDRMWTFICDKRKTHYIRAPIDLPIYTATDVVDAVWSRVTDRTRVLFLSHITSPTAIILPVAELIARARERGIITVIDGAHTPGQIPLDLHTLGADFYAGNCHKWMLAPKGSGFLYARRDMHHLLEPLIVSWGWHPETPGPSRLIDYVQWPGTHDPAAYLAVPAAIRFMETHHWPAVQRKCHALVRDVRTRITAFTGIPPLTPDSPDWFGQMAAFPLPAVNGAALHQQLYDRFRIEVPVTTWRDRNSFAYRYRDTTPAPMWMHLSPRCPL